MKKRNYIYPALLGLLMSCGQTQDIVKPVTPFVWEASNLYFLLVDRFENGDTTNDVNFDRIKSTGVLRGFEGGDLRGIINKLDQGYFKDLGVNVIWMNPIVEQIHDAVDEGTGNTYGFHGYWTKDWTAIDPNFGTAADLKELIEKAHAQGIRIMLDAVINHTGPVTEKDSVYPESWVRTSPHCTYDNYENTIVCTLVKNLPDVKTESLAEVELPQMLVDKWKAEGRYEQEVKELDAFFERTKLPRAPKYYIMKWLSDYIVDFGIDGYRVDTVKHTEEDVWADFEKVCQEAFSIYKKNNPDKVLDDNDFFLVGEVYGYSIYGKQLYDFGDKKVNYFENGFHSLINFSFKEDVKKDYEELFSHYANTLQTDLKGKSIMNYISSHDDGNPYDKKRENTREGLTKLFLTPGISQIYYGDESARSLDIEGTVGDATLRSFMNWNDIEDNEKTKELLSHAQKLGKFRKNHPAIGVGFHSRIQSDFYVFSRSFTQGDFLDNVVVALNTPKGKKEIPVGKIFENGVKVKDAYSGYEAKVKNGSVEINSPYDIVLLEKI